MFLSEIFWPVLGIGLGLVALQGVASWLDGRWSRAQLRSRGITNSYSFWEHGGMWVDVFIITPLVAYAVSKYELDCSSVPGVVALFASGAVTLVLIEMYRRGGIAMGDHCTHDGKTTLAGWIHGLFAFLAIGVCVEIYLGLTTPVVSKQDVIVFSTLLTPFFYLGVAKWSERWVFGTAEKWQVAAGIILVWIAAAVRIWGV